MLSTTFRMLTSMTPRLAATRSVWKINFTEKKINENDLWFESADLDDTDIAEGEFHVGTQQGEGYYASYGGFTVKLNINEIPTKHNETQLEFKCSVDVNNANIVASNRGT